MKRSFVAAAVLLAASLFAVSPARADDTNLAIGVHAGTLGYGISLEKPIDDKLAIRVQNGLFSLSANSTSNTVNYNGTLTFSNYATLVDFHPGGGHFRLTAGAVLGNDHINASGTPNGDGTYTINGNLYTAAQVGTLNGQVKLGGFAPYLGIGAGSSHKAGLSFTYDAGIAFRSSTASLSATGTGVGTAQFDADLAAAQAKLQSNANYLKTYPVIDIGLSYRL